MSSVEMMEVPGALSLSRQRAFSFIASA